MLSLVPLILLVAVKGFVVLSVLILVHELGHFVVAKWLGVWAEEFGLGLPPRALGKKIGETIYSVNWLPIGGFVRLHGEMLSEKAEFPERSFSQKPKLVRVVISLAGIVMNFVLALVCFAVVYSFLGIPRETGSVRITDIAAGSPAQTAGILVGDVVKKVDAKDIAATKDFISYVEEHKGKTIKVEVERTVNAVVARKIIQLVPRANPPQGEGPLGVAITSTEIYFPPIWQRPFVGAWYGAGEALGTSKAVTLGLFGVATEISHGAVPKGVVGPLGLLALINYIWSLGPIPLINFIGIVSINLAIINLIPFPPLDGSRVLFIGVEALLGKKMLPKVEEAVQSIGMGLLILLMIAITAREIPAALKAGTITKFVESIVK